MATLSKGDTAPTKLAGSGPYLGQTRFKIIQSKIKDKKPFLLGKDGKGGVIYGLKVTKNWPYEISYTEKKTGKKVEGVVKATQIFKDPDFGGGGGSGGGAADTEVTESLQCYYTSVLYNGTITEWKQLTKVGVDKKILGKYTTYCDANVPLDKCLKQVATKPSLVSWVDENPNVFIKTANAIKNSPAGKKFRGKVNFHRDSNFMNSIYDRRKRCMDHDKELAREPGGKMIAPGSFSNDKWNPGDIWMSKLSKSASDPFPGREWEGELETDTCDWDGLKGVVWSVANKGQTLGVSLKKVISAAHVTEYNRPKRKQNIDVKYLGFTFGQSGDFFSSADIYLYFKTSPGGAQAIQWRAFDSTKSWQGEIKGAAAAGGKIGGGGTNYYVEKYFNESIGGGGPKGKGWSEIQPNWNDAFTLYKKYNEKQLETKLKSGNVVPQTVKNKAEFDKEADAYLNNKGRNVPAAFKFGKYMGLLLIDAVMSNRPNKKDTATGNSWAIDTFRYAQSNIDISSYYIKVS